MRHTLTCVSPKRERRISLLVFTFLSFGASILRNLLLGFSQDKSLCYFCVVVLVYLSVIFWLVVMLL